MIGSARHWNDLREYLEKSYDFSPELVFYGKKYGWTIRYRKSGKTLISLFPEHGAFTALIVLGKKEGQKAAAILEELSTATRELVGGTKQLADGKWLWIRVHDFSQVADIKKLLAAKRRPLRQ